jgi:hypothetical protein
VGFIQEIGSVELTEAVQGKVVVNEDERSALIL